MALIVCEDCGREVSTKATACPHCGCPVPPPTAADPPSPAAVSGGPLPEAWTPPPPEPAPALGHSVPLKQDRSLEKRVFGGILAAVVLIVLLVGIWPSQSPEVDGDAATASSAADSAATSAAAAEAAAAADVAAAAANAATSDSSPTPAEPEAPPSLWTYSAAKDDIGDQTVYTATIPSTNTIELDFPYAGPQRGTLMLRRHPRHGRDVILSIERGQILCRSYGDCQVLVRIDDGPIQRLEGNEPADNSSEYVFIPIYQTLMKKLPTAKKVRVQIQIFQAGEQTFEFDVSGFEPKRMSSDA